VWAGFGAILMGVKCCGMVGGSCGRDADYPPPRQGAQRFPVATNSNYLAR
jgi:hypothetical protein